MKEELSDDTKQREKKKKSYFFSCTLELSQASKRGRRHRRRLEMYSNLFHVFFLLHSLCFFFVHKRGKNRNFFLKQLWASGWSKKNPPIEYTEYT